MSVERAGLDATISGLQARWGAAAPRTLGALALAPAADREVVPVPVDGRVPPTGFPALDALLGPGGLPRSASVAIRGDGSSGRTTLALRIAAEAQVAGSTVAWLDLGQRFDALDAASRGVALDWLVVARPTDLDEGLRMAGSLIVGRAVDLLVVDLSAQAAIDRPAVVADRLRRLAAAARRAESRLLVLDAPRLAGIVDPATAIRLDLRRRSWVRLGRRVVGLDAEVLVAHNRHGPTGRTATLRILYAQGSERDACLIQPDLLTDAPAERETDHATPPLLHPASRPAPGAGPPLRAVPTGTDRPGRATVGPGSGRRRRPTRPGAGRPARDAAGGRAPARP